MSSISATQSERSATIGSVGALALMHVVDAAICVGLLTALGREK